MASRILNVSEARRRLPGLVRNAARSGAVAIGARGHASAVLVGVQEYEALRARISRAGGGEKGWKLLKLESVGAIEEVEADLLALRREWAQGRRSGSGLPPRARRPPSR